MTKNREPAATERKLIGFSLKLSPGEMEFVESLKAKNGLSAAENIRAFINAFRQWFDLPSFMVDELRTQMEDKGLTLREYVREVLAREYVRTVHGEGERRNAPGGGR